MSFRARLFGLLGLFLLLAAPHALFAATLSFSPVSASHGVGEEFSVRVQVAPSESVNAADGTITFDPAVLSVVSISREGSAFSLWTADPAFSNSAGTVTFSGGTPTAFSTSGTALTIKFRGKATGTGAVSVSKASILAADGKGTDVYKSGTPASYTITASAPKPAAPEPEPEQEAEAVSGSTGDVLVPPPDITSSTHKKAEQWYATTTALFAWKIPVGMLSVRTSISQDQSEKPKKTYTPIIATETFKELTEGVWYFSAQYKDDFEWGAVAQREVRIDVTPPDEFEIALLNPGGDTPPKFTFAVTDALSGMGRYEIYFNDTVAATVSANDLVDNAFPVPPQGGGPTKVTIKAYDTAGNVREITKQMELPLVEKIDPKAAAAVPTDSGFRYEWIVIAVFAAAIGGLVAWQMQMKKATVAEQAQILQRVIDIRERNDKVFAAMREEFEQLINDFDEKPQLTPAERDLLEKMKEVLDISEEVVDSDIEQLKKLLKRQ